MSAEPQPLRRADNFLPLRHVAALLVIYGHSYDLTGHPGGAVDLIARWMPGFKAGSFAVYVFFAISGYLVTLSVIRHPSIIRYLRNRALRILPAYWASLLLCAFVIGPLLTIEPLRAYATDPGLWHFLSSNLVPISFEWRLPGLFADNPYPHVVNGSLWSLGLEVRWYAYLGLLLAVGVASRRAAFTTVAGAFLAWSAWRWWIGEPDPLQRHALSMLFLTAGLLAHWRDQLRIHHGWMLAALLLAAVTRDSRWFGAAATLAILFGTLWVAYRLPPLRWPRDVDYSYGIFLYGFPAQQALLALWPSLAPWTLCLLASMTSIALAMLSWHLLESPILRLRRPSSITPKRSVAVSPQSHP